MIFKSKLSLENSAITSCFSKVRGRRTYIFVEQRVDDVDVDPKEVLVPADVFERLVIYLVCVQKSVDVVVV